MDSLSSALGRVPANTTANVTVNVTQVGGTAGLPFGTVGVLKPHGAAGGLLRGPGTGTSDSIPLWGSAGEYMVRAASVDKYGKTMMDAINAGRYAQGGLLAGMLSSARQPTGYAAGGEVAASPFSLAVIPVGGASGRSPDTTIADHLADIKALLYDLCDLTAGAPGQTAAGMHQALAGGARRLNYAATYSTR